MSAAARMTSLSNDQAFARLSYPVLSNPESSLIEEKARAAGHAAGYASGAAAARAEAAIAREVADHRAAQELEAGARQVRRALDVLNTAVSALEARTVPVLESVEHQLAAAAVEVAEALIGRELAAGEDSARAALHRVMNTDVPAPVHTVRLNPADLAALPEEVRADASATLVADASLQPGDAVAEYPAGILDARLSTAVARFKAVLAAEVQQ